MRRLRRLICRIRDHRWMTRKGHDGTHHRCSRCHAGYIERTT